MTTIDYNSKFPNAVAVHTGTRTTLDSIQNNIQDYNAKMQETEREKEFYFIYAYGGADEPELSFVTTDFYEAKAKVQILRDADPLDARQFVVLEGTLYWEGDSNELDPNTVFYFTVESSSSGSYEPEIGCIELVQRENRQTLEDWHKEKCEEVCEPMEEESDDEKLTLDEHFAQQEMILVSFEVDVSELGKETPFLSVVTPSVVY